MKKIIALGLALGVPFFASAVDNTPGTIGFIIYTIASWISYIVPLLITVAIGYFIWGVISFITSSDEEAKKNGRDKIINGLIGLFVILAFWGIIALVQRTFFVSGDVNYSNSVTNGLLQAR